MSFFVETPTSRRAATEYNRAMKAVGELRRRISTLNREAFEAAGGCTRCRGRGWVVTWDTMDSMSGCYAEYGPCPERCGSSKSADTPYDWSDRTKYDHNRYEPGKSLVELGAMVGLQAEVEKAEELVSATKLASAQAREAATIRRGSWVVVHKGRKVAKGTEGRVFWIGEGRWGPRAGFKVTEDAEPTWIAVGNLQVVGA